MSTKDQYYYYPWYDNPNFNEIISKQKEFQLSYFNSNLPIKIEENTTAEDVIQAFDKRPFELESYQLFLKSFLNFQTPYNGILLFHGLGTGKTCTSIGIAEELRKSFIKFNMFKKIIIVASANVLLNFRNTLFDEDLFIRTNPNENIEKEDQYWKFSGCVADWIYRELFSTNEETNISRSQIIEKLNLFIQTNYSFYTYGKFVNAIQPYFPFDESNTLNKKKSKSKTKLPLELKHLQSLIKGKNKSTFQKEKEKQLMLKLQNKFDGRLIIIDEVHHFRTTNKLSLSLSENKDDSDSDSDSDLDSDSDSESSEDEDSNSESEDDSSFEDEKNTKEKEKKKEIDYVEEEEDEEKEGFQTREEIEKATEKETKINTKISSVFLEHLVKNTNFLRFILLSATPMYHESEELFWILTLLHLNDKRIKEANEISNWKKANMFETNGELTKEGKEKLITWTRGYISFVNGENPFEFPYRVYPEAFLTDIQENKIQDDIFSFLFYQINRENQKAQDILRGKVYLIPLTKNQNDLYQSTLKSLSKKMTIEFNLRQISSIVFPDNMLGENGFNVILTKTINNSVTTFSYIRSKHIGFFRRSKIQKYSNKIKTVLDYSLTSEGIVLIYAEFLKGLLLPMALALEECGYIRWNNNQAQPLLTNPQSRSAQSTNGHYILITGDNSLSPNWKENLKTLVSEENTNGEKIKFVLMSMAGSEGLDLKNIRQVFILTPWFNLSRLEQIIGRSVRKKSHVNLPISKRNVQIFMLCSYGSYETIVEKDNDNNEEQVEKEKEKEEEEEEEEEPRQMTKEKKYIYTSTTDVMMYQRASNLALQIGILMRVIKENAIDCRFNIGQLNFTNENLQENYSTKISEIEQTLSERDKRVKIKIGYKPFTFQCDYLDSCNYTCLPYLSSSSQSISKSSWTMSKANIQIDSKILEQFIANMFHDFFFFSFNDIVDRCKIRWPQIESSLILYTLRNMIKEETKIFNRFGKAGHLSNIGTMFVFRPLKYESYHKHDPKKKLLTFSFPSFVNEQKYKTLLTYYDANALNQNGVNYFQRSPSFAIEAKSFVEAQKKKKENMIFTNQEFRISRILEVFNQYKSSLDLLFKNFSSWLSSIDSFSFINDEKFKENILFDSFACLLNNIDKIEIFKSKYNENSFCLKLRKSIILIFHYPSPLLTTQIDTNLIQSTIERIQKEFKSTPKKKEKQYFRPLNISFNDSSDESSLDSLHETQISKVPSTAKELQYVTKIITPFQETKEEEKKEETKKEETKEEEKKEEKEEEKEEEKKEEEEEQFDDLFEYIEEDNEGNMGNWGGSNGKSLNQVLFASAKPKNKLFYDTMIFDVTNSNILIESKKHQKNMQFDISFPFVYIKWSLLYDENNIFKVMTDVMNEIENSLLYVLSAITVEGSRLVSLSNKEQLTDFFATFSPPDTDLNIMNEKKKRLNNYIPDKFQKMFFIYLYHIYLRRLSIHPSEEYIPKSKAFTFEEFVQFKNIQLEQEEKQKIKKTQKKK